LVVVGLISSYVGEQCWRAVNAVEWVQSALACFDADFVYTDAAGPTGLSRPIALTNGHRQHAALSLLRQGHANVDRELGQAVPRSIERLRRGQCQGIVATATMPTSKNGARDVPAGQRKTTKLRQREERFRSLAACAPAGILQMDPACRCVYSNCSGQLMGGFSAEEGAGDGWARFLHPEDRVRVLPAWFAAMQAGEEFACEFRFQTPDARRHKEMMAPRERWVRLRSSPMVSDLGKLIGHVAVLHDIHEQKVAEEALHETRMLLSAVAQALQMQANSK
jgi:PAS domain S-box-containing protein